MVTYTCDLDVRLLHAVVHHGPHLSLSRKESGPRWEAVAGVVNAFLSAAGQPPLSVTAHSVRTRVRNLVSRWTRCRDSGVSFRMPRQPSTQQKPSLGIALLARDNDSWLNDLDLGEDGDDSNSGDYLSDLGDDSNEHSFGQLFCVDQEHGTTFFDVEDDDPLIKERSLLLADIVEKMASVANLKTSTRIAAANRAAMSLVEQVAASRRATPVPSLRTRYTVAQRLEAVLRAREIGMNKAAKEFGINKCLISRWTKHAETWVDGASPACDVLANASVDLTRRRMKKSAKEISKALLDERLLETGTGKVCSPSYRVVTAETDSIQTTSITSDCKIFPIETAAYAAQEEILKNWIYSQNNIKAQPTHSMIRKKMLQLVHASTKRRKKSAIPFEANRSWLYAFLKRAGLKPGVHTRGKLSSEKTEKAHGRSDASEIVVTSNVKGNVMVTGMNGALTDDFLEDF
ncbi:hypothetical protein HDU83_002216 [Entophlyctis luteolus]|nr:hypothetical protein HDU82_003265 [Entophlyctis luteolus]KAJ3355931.1 hypothetical protein HDU83_002216 [Entophlyctis luteolus]